MKSKRRRENEKKTILCGICNSKWSAAFCSPFDLLESLCLLYCIYYIILFEKWIKIMKFFE